MDENQTRERSSFSLSVSILVSALIVGGAIVYSVHAGSGNRAANVGSSITPQAGTSLPTVDDDVVLGDPAAKVTIIEFGDYQCPYCGQMFKDTEGLLREQYIKTGKAKMVFRDFPLDTIHPYARPTAEAAECARDQNKYWEYHDMLFQKQSLLATLNYVTEAGALGLDTTKFSACVSSHKYQAEVEKDYADGVAAGISGTPGTFINGELISGAVPYSNFQAAIERALAKK